MVMVFFFFFTFIKPFFSLRVPVRCLCGSVGLSKKKLRGILSRYYNINTFENAPRYARASTKRFARPKPTAPDACAPRGFAETNGLRIVEIATDPRNFLHAFRSPAVHADSENPCTPRTRIPQREKPVPRGFGRG